MYTCNTHTHAYTHAHTYTHNHTRAITQLHNLTDSLFLTHTLTHTQAHTHIHTHKTRNPQHTQVKDTNKFAFGAAFHGESPVDQFDANRVWGGIDV